MTSAIAALILAGGQSSRMGQDKALIPVHGVPLVRRVYEAAAPSCKSLYVISAWSDRYRSVLPKACQFIDEQSLLEQSSLEPNLLELAVKERIPQKGQTPQHCESSLLKQDIKPVCAHGPLVGFYQGLIYLNKQIVGSESDNWVLLLACDLPNLHAAVIQNWSDRLAHCSDSTTALLPPHGTKGWHPLCGFYNHRCLPSLKRFIAQGGRSFQKWLAQEEVRSIPVDDANLLFNCNTPTDLEQLFQTSSD